MAASASSQAAAVSSRKRKARRRRQDKPALSARLVLDDHVKGDVGILSEDLFSNLFPQLALGKLPRPPRTRPPTNQSQSMQMEPTIQHRTSYMSLWHHGLQTPPLTTQRGPLFLSFDPLPSHPRPYNSRHLLRPSKASQSLFSKSRLRSCRVTAAAASKFCCSMSRPYRSKPYT
jgi:hypothetical protein